MGGGYGMGPGQGMGPGMGGMTHAQTMPMAGQNYAYQQPPPPGGQAGFETGAAPPPQQMQMQMQQQQFQMQLEQRGRYEAGAPMQELPAGQKPVSVPKNAHYQGTDMAPEVRLFKNPAE